MRSHTRNDKISLDFPIVIPDGWEPYQGYSALRRNGTVAGDWSTITVSNGAVGGDGFLLQRVIPNYFQFPPPSPILWRLVVNNLPIWPWSGMPISFVIKSPIAYTINYFVPPQSEWNIQIFNAIGGLEAAVQCEGVFLRRKTKYA